MASKLHVSQRTYDFHTRACVDTEFLANLAQLNLEVEEFVSEKDIGNVGVDEDVTIKLDAFDFTKYGVIKGKVDLISSDLQLDDQKGLIYAVRISFNAIHEVHKTIEIKSGMSLAGEVVTDEQSVLSFFVSKPIRNIIDFGVN